MAVNWTPPTAPADPAPAPPAPPPLLPQILDRLRASGLGTLAAWGLVAVLALHVLRPGSISFLPTPDGAAPAPAAHAPVKAAATAYLKALAASHDAVADGVEKGAIARDRAAVAKALGALIEPAGKAKADAEFADPDLPGALRATATIYRGGK